MKQANDAKKIRNEGRKRDESPSSLSFSHSSLLKKPRVDIEGANLLLNLNESTNQNSSFGTPAFNSNSNNFNSSNNSNNNNAGNMFRLVGICMWGVAAWWTQ